MMMIVRMNANAMTMVEMMIMIVNAIKKRIIALSILVIKLLTYYMELIKMFRSLNVMLRK